MPKLVVLYSGADRTTAALAAAVADGARTIRFTEVDVRVLGAHEPTAGAGTGSRVKPLESVETLGVYDGVVIVTGANSDSRELSTLFDTLQARVQHAAEHHGSPGPFADIVFAVTGGDSVDSLLARVGRLGAISVGAGATADPEARARHLGARTAKVIGWVRHALGHEADAHHHHEHGQHGHSHDHHH